MDKDDIKLSDLQRILFGEAPPEFLLEVFCRTLIIYVLTLVVMRWLGKRMNGQLTITELAVMITMGAIISVPMQVPDKGLLPGVVTLLGALVFLRGINLISYKNKKFETLTQGRARMLVKNGVLILEELTKTNISKQQLFASLRHNGVYNLGAAKRVYLEGCGLVSIYKNAEMKPGLPLFPPSDNTILDVAASAPGLKARRQQPLALQHLRRKRVGECCNINDDYERA